MCQITVSESIISYKCLCVWATDAKGRKVDDACTESSPLGFDVSVVKTLSPPFCQSFSVFNHYCVLVCTEIFFKTKTVWRGFFFSKGKLRGKLYALQNYHSSLSLSLYCLQVSVDDLNILPALWPFFLNLTECFDFNAYVFQEGKNETYFVLNLNVRRQCCYQVVHHLKHSHV